MNACFFSFPVWIYVAVRVAKTISLADAAAAMAALERGERINGKGAAAAPAPVSLALQSRAPAGGSARSNWHRSIS